MMRYSCALALMLILTLAVSSQGFRQDPKHNAKVNFQQWQDAEDTEEPSFAQEEVEKEMHNEMLGYDEGGVSATLDEERLGQAQEDTNDAEGSPFLQEEQEEQDAEESSLLEESSQSSK